MQLGFTITEFKEMEVLKNEIKPVIQLWETIEEFDATIETWKNTALQYIRVEEIDESCNEWMRKL